MKNLEDFPLLHITPDYGNRLHRGFTPRSCIPALSVHHHFRNDQSVANIKTADNVTSSQGRAQAGPRQSYLCNTWCAHYRPGIPRKAVPPAARSTWPLVSTVLGKLNSPFDVPGFACKGRNFHLAIAKRNMRQGLQFLGVRDGRGRKVLQ